MLKPSQKNKTVLSTQHKLRREKELACAYDSLTTHDIRQLLNFCYQSDDYQFSHLLLASLYSARSISHLMDAQIRLEVSVTDCGQFGILYSSMKHPDSLTSSNNSEPFIFLPSTFLMSIREAQKSDIEEIENKLKSHLTEINKKHSTRLTLGRIKRYLIKEAAEFNLSQAEVSFIADNRIREHAGSSYLSISAKELSEQHFRYLNHVQSLAQQEQFEIGSVLDSTSAEKVMGSNRSMPNKEIIILFSEMKNVVNVALKKLPSSIWQIYNDYTLFTVCLLYMSTGHRPSRSPFGTLQNFDLIREVVWIQDKQAREGANRLLPIGKISSQHLKNYLSFLEKVKDVVKYSYPAEAESIGQSLSSQADLFKLKGNTGMTFFSATTQREYCTTTHKFAKNWHRHWLRQLLAKQPNINPSATDAFMGHENLLDESFSIFSSLDVTELRKISEAIEREFAVLGIDALRVAL